MVNATDTASARESFVIRRGVEQDAAVIATQRARMFREMGRLDEALFPALVRDVAAYTARATASGEYVAWLAFEHMRPDVIVGGAGALLRTVPPYPVGVGTPSADIAAGKQAHIVNVYVEPTVRRRGLARALMTQVLAWCNEQRIDSVTLHASAQGRALYEQLGFEATNQMRIPMRSFPGE